MRPVIDQTRWETALTETHKLAVSAYVLDGTTETELEITDGSVTLDATAAVRGRCDVTLVDDGSLGLIPSAATDQLAPYGNEIRLCRGVETASFTELVSLGIFRIEDVDVDESGSIRITGVGREQRIIDAAFEEPYQIASGTNVGTAIADTLAIAYPDIETNFATTSLLTPAVLIAEEGEDRWAFCQGLATASGAELFFDGDGVCVLRPTPQGSAVYTIAEGEGGVLVEAARHWTRQGAFNRVIVTGENSGNTPVRGVATDDNPLSPTYYYGDSNGFGKVPHFWSSPYITTTDQAHDAAEGILAKQLGTTQSVDFGAIVNPALEPGDVVRITRERIGVDEDHIIDTLTIPLDAEGAMSGQTRATQVAS